MSTHINYNQPLFIGAGTFFCIYIYNQITQKPNEKNDNSYLLKISIITSVVALVIMNSHLHTAQSGIPCEKSIMTNFDK